MSVRTIRNSLPLWCLTYKKYEYDPIAWHEYWRDDFDDGVLAYEWMTHGKNPPGRTIIENAPPNETLNIAVTAGTDARWWHINNKAPKIYMPLDVLGPCRITTKLNSFNADPPGAQNEETQAGIFIGYNPTGTTFLPANRYAYIWGLWDDSGAGNGFLVVANCATPTYTFSPICASDCLPRCLRINILATGEIEFWSVGLADGEDCWADKVWPDDWLQHPWTVPASDNYPIENCFVGLIAKHYSGTFNAMNANFENFVIEVQEARRSTEPECYAPIDVRGPTTFYEGRLQSMATLKRAIDDKTGLFQVADMNLTLKNTDKHFSSKMTNRILKDQEAVLYHAWTDEPEDNKSHMITMIVDDYSIKGTDFLVKLKDISQKYFTQQVPADICTSDDYAHINPDHEGRCKPEILGKAEIPTGYEHEGAVEAVYVDTTTGRYIAANYPLHNITAVFVDDVPRSEGVGANDYAWGVADGDTYIDFVTAPGTDEVVSFNAEGYFRDAWDDPTNGYIQNPAYIILFYLRFIMGIPASLIDFPAFATLAQYYIDIGEEQSFYLILQYREDAMEVLRQMLFSAGAKGWINMAGKFTIARKDVDDWEIESTDHHLFEQIDLIGSPHRKWNMTEAINTINIQYGYIPWQNLYIGAKSEYRENPYDRRMEDERRMGRPRKR